MSKFKDEHSWRYGGIKRRDFRHTHNGPEEPRHIGKKKNTKRWCKGKVGREHVWRLASTFDSPLFGWYSLKKYRCTNCDKQTYNP